MPPQTHRSPGRLLAPFALLVVFGALFLIVLGSAGPGGTETSEDGSRAFTTPPARPERTARGVYTVKPGDTLGSIAERNGTTVDRLLELNADLDAQSLVTGQKIKLRE